MWAVIIGGVPRKGNLPAAGTNRVLSVIDARFSEPSSLAELAAADALSERSLNRFFVRPDSCPFGRLVPVAANFETDFIGRTTEDDLTPLGKSQLGLSL